MKLLPRILNVDLRLEHAGHLVNIKGSEMRYVATFPTFSSLLHYAIVFWPARKTLPEAASVEIQYRRFHIAVKSGKA
jgi:hypothetical protein